MIDASVIVSYVNSKDSLPRLLSHLRAQDYPSDKFEVILVNGDDYKPRASQAKGQMIGFHQSKGRIIFFIDSDRYPPPSWISTHMKFYPKWDLVAGNVIYHTTKVLQAMNFGNISMKREVLDAIPIRDIPSQQDADFAFRFVRQNRFKGKIDSNLIWEPADQKWSWRHQFLMAQNIMVLRKLHHVMPSLSDFNFRLRHPAALMGSVAGLFASNVVNAHDGT